LIYGANHIAIIEKLSKAHHKSITKYPSHHASGDSVLSIKEEISTNGTGKKTNNLYKAKIIKVKYILSMIYLLLSTEVIVFKDLFHISIFS